MAHFGCYLVLKVGPEKRRLTWLKKLIQTGFF